MERRARSSMYLGLVRSSEEYNSVLDSRIVDKVLSFGRIYISVFAIHGAYQSINHHTIEMII